MMCDITGRGNLIPTCALADLFYLDREREVTVNGRDVVTVS